MKITALKRINFILLVILLGAFLSACGGDSSGGGSGSSSQGKLSISLTDSTTDQYQAVYVTITRVDVHMADGNGWETFTTPNKTYNLLELVNGVRESLGITSLAAGHYTQMRLIIGEVADQSLNILGKRHPYANYIIGMDNLSHELKVPSGTNTGLKIVHGFDINEKETTELILGFDAMRSVVKAGASGKYLLKPTIKVLTTENYSIISGWVLDGRIVEPLSAFITAQIADPDQVDIADQVIIKAGTLANDEGNYSLFLEPGEYNLVVSKTGYIFQCAAVTLPADSETIETFSLDVEEEGLGGISGTVNTNSASPDQYVTIDFRQQVTCNDAQETALVTVKTINVVNGDTYTVEIPAGDYQVVAYTYDKTTLSFDHVTVESGELTSLDITFE